MALKLTLWTMKEPLCAKTSRPILSWPPLLIAARMSTEAMSTVQISAEGMGTPRWAGELATSGTVLQHEALVVVVAKQSR